MGIATGRRAVIEPDADHHGALALITQRLAAVHWSWLMTDLDELVAQLGWTERPPTGGHSVHLNTHLPFGIGLAFVYWSGDESERVVLPVTDQLPAFPDRVDAFAAAAATLTDVLGEPVDRRPGPRPTVWWPATSGFLGVIDDGDGIDLELRPTALPQSASTRTRGPTAQARQPDEADEDWDDDDDLLADDPQP